MNDDQLTALAREYAEEGAEEVGLPNCLQNETFGLVVTETECVIKWLLRRFCLVEKSKVEDIHKGILVQLDPKNFGYSPYNQGRIDLLKSLFPEIAIEENGDYPLCIAQGANSHGDFGYRFSQKLTDRLKENYETPNI